MIVRRYRFSIHVVLAVAGLAACQPADRDGPAEESAIVAETPPAGAFVAEYTARDYAFVGPAELPSGWVTIRMANDGLEHHFVFLTLLPEGKTMKDYVSDVGMPFDSVWHQLRSGAVDKAGAGVMLGELLPEWYADASSMGGPGLVAPGGVGQATMRLAPGDYVMECYVKTAEGEFHVNLGMAMPLTVTAEDSGASPPTPDLEITLFNSVIEVEGTPTAGQQTVAVHFDEHPEYGPGNDVHVVRLDEGTDLDEDRPMDGLDERGRSQGAVSGHFRRGDSRNASRIHGVLHRGPGAGSLRVDRRVRRRPGDGGGVHGRVISTRVVRAPPSELSHQPRIDLERFGPAYADLSEVEVFRVDQVVRFFRDHDARDRQH